MKEELKDYTFCDGVVTLNNELTNKTWKVFEMLESTEGLLSLCKTDRAKVEARKKRDVEHTEMMDRMKAAGKVMNSVYGDDRFVEYIAQIKIDKHDPADMLEAWLKEHNPDFFRD